MLIVNPVAGRGKTEELAPALFGRLKACGLPFEARFTKGPDEATEIAKEAAEEGFTRLVAVGGDGTAHEVANGLLAASNKPAALGVIPTGSGNDFAKAIGIPLELSEAVETLAHNHRRRIDLGRLGGRYFVNGLGIGLDGAVSHRYRRMKHLSGELGYLWGAIHEALTFKAFDLGLSTPGWSFRGPALLAGASNGQYQGGNFRLTPHASVEDGQLDVYVILDIAPLRRLIEIPKVRRGAHLALKEVEIHRAPWAEIALERPLPAHMDGEPFTLGPGKHHVEVVPQGLEVISGRTGSPQDRGSA